ncbi:unnamed protein product [Rotaria sordida]|uniref:Uncharacterized protein n=1 Tax=Rotaria sordida TaxID=392033 RepID=A0A814LLB9_9BILA|nr:unnamed protein product [Rotaria sordida]
MATGRLFVNMLIESQLKKDKLREIAEYLQSERERLNRLFQTTEGGAGGGINDYQKDMNILEMEEKILYLLVDYLQKTGVIKKEE